MSLLVVLGLLFLIPICFLGLFWEIMNFILLIFFILFNSVYYTSFFSYISYSLGGDFFSWSMVFLSFWVVILMILSGFNVKNSDRSSEFLILCVFMILFLFLCFTTLNAFMFYVYFESTLIPTLFFIFGWGYQPERLNSGFYLLFYTLFASLPLLVGIIYVGFSSGSFFWFYLIGNNNLYLYYSMIVAFLVKLPIFMMHFWLLSAHVEAPVFGSMILAGVLLKLGGYGLFRVFGFMYMFHINISSFMVSFGLFSILVVGFICLLQTDIKCLIAYSSVAHMSMVICGLFTFNLWGLLGSLVLMIGHGLCSSGLFVLASIVYDRSYSRSLFINKGMMAVMPSLGLFWFLLSISNMSSPPSLNLLGELLLFNSIMSWSVYSMWFLMIGSFLNCCYMIYLYCMTQHGFIYGGFMVGFNVSIREYLLVFMHWFPLNLFVLKFDIFLVLI